MKKLYSLLIFTCFLAILSHPASAENTAISACARHPEFIQPVDSTEAQVIWGTIVKTAELQKTREFFNNEKFIKLYKADINNDSISEYIAILEDTSSGTVGQFHIVLAFRKEGGKFISLGEPPKPANAGDGYWYSQISNPFLTQLCDKNYITFLDPVSDGAAYLWEKSVTHTACNSDWLVYQRDKASKLYQAGDYNGAFTQLNLYLDACTIPELSSNSLWMLNDAAFYAFKLGKLPTCLTLLDQIKKHPQYSYATPALQKAVAFNYSLCKLQEKKSVVLDPPHGKNAYRWLLGKAPYPTAKVHELLLNTIPGTWEPNKDSIVKKEASADIVDFQLFDTKPEVIDNRYVWIERRWPHSFGDAVFLWVDVSNGTSIIGRTVEGGMYNITSKNYNAETVPFAAKQAIAKTWEYDNKNTDNNHKKIIFFDWVANKDIILPMSWLMSR